MIASSIRTRLVLLALAWIAVALVVAAFVISGLLRQFVEEGFEASLDSTLIALMASTEEDLALGRITVDAAVADPRFEQPLSGWYWQIADEDAVLLRSGSLWTDDLGAGAEAASGAVLRRTLQGPEGMALRALSRDFTAPGGTSRLRVTAAMPEAEIEARVAGMVGPLLTSLVLLGAGLVLAIALQVHFGLAPLKRLRDNLGRVHRGELPSLPAERYAEIAPVVEEMNALIAHNRKTIARARTHVGNLAHGLKTPLSVLDTSLARPPGPERETALAEVSASMNRMIGHHLRRARSAITHGVVGERSDVGEAVADLVPVFAGIYADRGLALETELAPGTVFAGERQDLDELIGNLIDNGCKWAKARVRVSAARSGPREISIIVRDDGPGLSTEDARLALERGRRLDEQRPGSGLGLAIVSDIAGLYEGRLEIGPGETGGTEARLILPAPPLQ
ncbi:sensor histidine kinase [Arsenicitalea aurantiaca]|uniref:histidine kinase n=1 Tax=Arsenicitalea aurantiaca TaxID=1783274 RepID=A0A433X5K9_9HYPH|nr:ATP-binding protein [Arsenicitalea aurantiaca]RUT29365.1 sensor histidine kinase [Arsenicitalea aurantiaca]